MLLLSAIPVSSAEPLLSPKRIVVIDKGQRELVLLKEGRPVGRFPATFGIDPDSDKFKAFDGATPEGVYVVTEKRSSLRFNRLLGLSYPNRIDAQRGLVEGTIPLAEYQKITAAIEGSRRTPDDTGLGGGVAIHGGGVFRDCGSTTERDWTEGCIALNNQEMEQVFAFCRRGDPVIIFNGRRNLYGMLRPFALITDIDGYGLPTCPEGICSAQVEIRTALGQVRGILKEGKGYGRALSLTVYSDNEQAEPLLALVDRNGDGEIASMDTLSGPLAEGASQEAVYQKVQEAVITALAAGYVIAPDGGW